jgi:hypothetical protein
MKAKDMEVEVENTNAFLASEDDEALQNTQQVGATAGAAANAELLKERVVLFLHR